MSHNRRLAECSSHLTKIRQDLISVDRFFIAALFNLPIIVAIRDGRIGWSEHGRSCAPTQVAFATAACGTGLLGGAVLAR
jgi:hypothetical protein